jgi:mono/diheme cytochrome c family protein
MKRIAAIIVAVLTIWPPQAADAGCRVACRQQAVQEQFVALATAIPIGVPVGQYGATTYSYDARPVNVTVNVNGDAIAEAVVAKLTAKPKPATAKLAESPPPATTPAPSASSGQAPPAAVAAQCAKCHAAGANAAAFAKFDASNLAALTCEQRLAAARDVLSEKMPKGHKLTAEEAGNVLTELIGK